VNYVDLKMHGAKIKKKKKQMECVYCPVRTEYLYTIQLQITFLSPYRINGGQSGTETGFPQFGIIPPMLHTHIHVPVSSYRKDKGANLGNLSNSDALSEISEHWIEKYFHFF